MDDKKTTRRSETIRKRQVPGGREAGKARKRALFLLVNVDLEIKKD